MAQTLSVEQIRELTDDELADLGRALHMEQERRFRLRRGVSWVEDIRQSIKEGEAHGG